MSTLKETWETYRDDVLIATARKQGLPPLPPHTIESFRRCFYCGAASVYMSLVKPDKLLAGRHMDSEKIYDELKEFAAEMRIP